MNAVVMLAAALSASGGAPVPVVVPLPVVVPEQPKRDFKACMAEVKAGRTVLLAVGVTPEDGDYSVKELEWPDGRKANPGRYECFLYEGKPSWRSVQRVLQSLPAVQITGPFGGGVRIGGG